MNRSRITTLASLLALGTLPALALGCAADASGDGEGTSATNAAVSTVPILPPIATNPPVYAAPVFTTTASGAGWQRVTISGTAADGASLAPVSVNGDYWVISGRESIGNVKLPAKTAAALTSSMAASPRIAGDHELIFFPKSASDAIESGAVGAPVTGVGGIKADYSCSDTSGTLSHTFNFSQPYSTTKTTDGNGLTGSANLSANVSGSLEGGVSYTIKKVWCIPYPVIHNVQVGGGAGVTAGATINATFSKPWSYSTELAEPTLGTITLPVIPIPITFSLPVRVGVDASAAATVNASASVYANASFQIECSSSGCDGSKSASAGLTPNKPPTFSSTGRVKVTPWAEVDLKAYVISGSLLSAQIGVRAGMQNDLFAYSGNACGDADNDGKPEFVSGATVDTRVDVSLQAAATVFGDNLGPYSWDLWNTHAGFWTVYDNGLLEPIFYSAPHDGSTKVTMEGRMRPCWPYSDAINYAIGWGDSTSTALTLPPAWLFQEPHVLGSYGAHTLTLEAVNDAAGRTLNATTTRGQYLSPIVIVPLPGGGVLEP